MSKKKLTIVFLLTCFLTSFFAPSESSLKLVNASMAKMLPIEGDARAQNNNATWTIDLWSALSEEIDLPSGVRIGGFGIMENAGGLYVLGTTGNDVWKIYKSTDNGQTWVEKLTTYARNNDGTFVTSQGWLIVPLQKRDYDMFVSKDDGETWMQSIVNISPMQDAFVELSNGTILIYTHGPAAVYKTNDGQNFTMLWNITQVFLNLGLTWPSDAPTPPHGHDMTYDPIYNRLYVASGDYWGGYSINGREVSKVIAYTENWGQNWTLIPNFGGPITGVSTPYGTFFGPDWENDILLHNRNNETVTIDALSVNGAPRLVHNSLYFNDVLYMSPWSTSTQFDYGIYVSPDGGKTWGILIETQKATGLYSIAKGVGDNIWVIHTSANKLYKLRALTHREAVWLTHKDSVSIQGDMLTYERIIGNGTDWIDFSSYGVSDVNLTFVGTSYANWLTNPSFEGSYGGWLIDGVPPRGVTTKEAKFGSYSFNVNGSTLGVLIFYQDYIVSRYVANNIVTAFIWAKTNETVAESFSMFVSWANDTHSDYRGKRCNTNTTWQKNELSAVIPSWATKVRVKYIVTKKPKAFYFDGAFLDIAIESHPQKQYDAKKSLDYYGGEKNTTNPKVTINSTDYFYSGSLTNNMSSVIASNIPIKAGTIRVATSVLQSGIVKIKMQGVIAVNIENAILTDFTNKVYVGKYYGTVNVKLTDSSLMVLSDKKSTLTVDYYSGNVLKINVSATSGYVSATKIYCGEKGKPMKVLVDYAEQIINYDTSSKILTVAVAHSSSSEILVDWTVRDLAITNAMPSDSEVYVGQIVNITVTSANEGNVPETFSITAIYENVTLGILGTVGTHEVINLAPGKNITLTFRWNTTDVQPCVNYTIKAEASVVPGEVDTGDNTYIDGGVTVNGLGIDLLPFAVAGIVIAMAAVSIFVYVLRIRKPKPL